MFEFLRGGLKVHRYGNFLCSVCRSNKMQRIEEIGNYISRWRCKNCGHTCRYDQRPSIPLRSDKEPKGYNPYGSFSRGIKLPQNKILNKEIKNNQT